MLLSISLQFRDMASAQKVLKVRGSHGDSIEDSNDKSDKKRVIYKCAHCPFKTAGTRCLQAHINTHQSGGVNAFCCPKDGCYYRTIKRTKWQQHLECHKTIRVKVIPCPLCSKQFYTKRLMRNHLRSHTNEREPQC